MLINYFCSTDAVMRQINIFLFNFQTKCYASRRMQDVVYIPKHASFCKICTYCEARTTSDRNYCYSNKSHWHWQSRRPCACSRAEAALGRRELHLFARCNSHFLGEMTSSFWLTRDETPLHIIMTIFICSTQELVAQPAHSSNNYIVSPSSWLREWAWRKRAEDWWI